MKIDFVRKCLHFLKNREMTPGQQDCEQAMEELRRLFQEVDKAIMNVDSLCKTNKSIQVRYFILRIAYIRKFRMYTL